MTMKMEKLHLILYKHILVVNFTTSNTAILAKLRHFTMYTCVVKQTIKYHQLLQAAAPNAIIHVEEARFINKHMNPKAKLQANYEKAWKNDSFIDVQQSGHVNKPKPNSTSV